MDRLRAYEVFVTVVARGSFTKAADALDTSPANVTRYVNELEAHLRTRLINRTSRRLSLTEGGEALFDRAKSILEEVAETEALATTASLQPRGRLRINAPLSFGSLVLAPLWPKFMAKYPDVELDIALIDRVVDIVEEGYDLAIRISRTTSGNHIARRLGRSQNLVCASPGYLAAMACPRSRRTWAAHVPGLHVRCDLRRVAVCRPRRNARIRARALGLAGQQWRHRPRRGARWCRRHLATELRDRRGRAGRSIGRGHARLSHAARRHPGDLRKPPPSQREGAGDGRLSGRRVSRLAARFLSM
jgi:DNA-binding transcriptional LysR family regulator